MVKTIIEGKRFHYNKYPKGREKEYTYVFIQNKEKYIDIPTDLGDIK